MAVLLLDFLLVVTCRVTSQKSRVIGVLLFLPFCLCTKCSEYTQLISPCHFYLQGFQLLLSPILVFLGFFFAKLSSVHCSFLNMI